MRTFIAIELPSEVRTAISRRRQQLAAQLAQAGLGDCFRWSAVQNIHLTLRFLGETDPSQQARIEAGLAQTAPNWHGFELCVGEAGGFPTLRRPNVLWLGLTGELPALLAMQRGVEQIARTAGFAAETKSFSPHLTLARAARGCGRTQLQAAGELVQSFVARSTDDLRDEPPCFAVTEVVHMHSDLRGTGPIYTPLSVHRLGD